MATVSRAGRRGRGGGRRGCQGAAQADSSISFHLELGRGSGFSMSFHVSWVRTAERRARNDLTNMLIGLVEFESVSELCSCIECICRGRYQIALHASQSSRYHARRTRYCVSRDNIKASQADDSQDILPDGSTVETRIYVSKLIIKIKKGESNLQ
jgi:hypothetical protein